MKLRIAIWAAVGALVVVLWTLYIAATSSAPHGITWALVCLICPISLLGHDPMNFYVVLLANVVTYALAGTVVEIIRRRIRHSEFA